MSATPTTFSIDRLREGLEGRVIVPGDSDYDEARTVTYGGFEPRPARDRASRECRRRRAGRAIRS